MLRPSLFSVSVSLLLALGLGSTLAHADEGQWKPDQISELDSAQLKSMGLELNAAQLWNPAGNEHDGGLMRAVVNLSGCTAAFISSDGLIATNHHCSYSAIQAQSTIDHDYLGQGFLARSPDQELEANGKTVRVLRKVSDVTATIQTAINEGHSPRAQAEAVSLAKKSLIKICETSSNNHRCSVASFYSGSLYELHEYIEIRDIRLVYAPPASIGEYGGEVDNWMWPRHTGDFSLLRAYVAPDGTSADFSPNNIPYQPARHLEISSTGVSPGDFVAILGFPGHTDRYLAASEIRRHIDQVLPNLVDVYGEWIDILDSHANRDDGVAIKVASTKKRLANRHKNARGKLEGLSHMSLIDRREREDEALAAWARQPGHEAYIKVLDDLQALSVTRKSSHERDFLLKNVATVSKKLATAVDLIRRAREQSRPDLERPGTYMARNEARLRSRIIGRIRDYDEGVEVEIMASILKRLTALPKTQKIEGLERSFKGRSPKTAAAWLVKNSVLADKAVVISLFEQASIKTISRLNDPMFRLAKSIVDQMEASEATAKNREGRQLVLGPLHFEMIQAVRKGPVYPDANSTMRFSFATVKGYSKWDKISQSAQSTLSETVDKHTGEDPFNLPPRVLSAAAKATKSYWSGPKLKDVPVCFLANADTTGGNSGSPVIDGKGRFVGLNFDRVWENIAGDYGYNPNHSRNISVDVRYLLWMLDEVEHADTLLTEMGVAQFSGKPRRDMPSTTATPSYTNSSELEGRPAPESASSGPGCSAPSASSSPPTAGLFAGFVVLFGLRRRRRSR